MPPAPVSTARKEETCILIGLIHKHQNENLVTEYLDELAFLAETAGAKTLRRFTQRMESPDSKTFIGTGKLQEIAAYIKTNAVDLAIFDDELSGTQIRNIEKALECRILDRNNLILDIFAKRARTAQAKAQVELAQYQYLLPRLTRMWTHLEKQRGGIGMRGPGESEIETDRRVIRDKLAKLKGKLRDFEKQSATQRKQRSEMIRVALVGYTNVGKSTLMNLLSKSEVFAENKLFATLDTTVRKIVYDRVPFLLSDTVGFIRKLPHDLIESFKSTLDEVREADILIHVVDISHPQFEDHIHVVNQTLVDIGATDKPTILVFNKIDAYHYIPKEEDDLTPATRENMSLEDLKKSWISNIQGTCIFISAVNRTNVEELRLKLTEMVKELHFVRYPNYLDNDSSSGE
ncbi:MAG: GTPase HflX [Bacteroidetes bacterium]|nr:GTPase HflX [Bacteroidota bacterium]MBK9541637.1 GTPase HflX [Bacteroidota bacterium]